MYSLFLFIHHINLLEAKLFCYSDYISHTTKLLAKTIVDDKGNFQLNISVHKTQDLFIKIGEHRVDFYCAPDSNYNITIYRCVIPGQG